MKRVLGVVPVMGLSGRGTMIFFLKWMQCCFSIFGFIMIPLVVALLIELSPFLVRYSLEPPATTLGADTTDGGRSARFPFSDTSHRRPKLSAVLAILCS